MIALSRDKAASGRLYGAVLLPALLLLEAIVRGPAPGPTPSPARAVPVPAAVVTLAGQVNDPVRNAPIEEAAVAVPELRLETHTDAEGRFRIGGVPVREKPYEILVTCPGYQSSTVMATAAGNTGDVELETLELRPLGW